MRDRVRFPITATPLAVHEAPTPCPQCGGPTFDVTLGLSAGVQPITASRHHACGRCSWCVPS